MDEALQFLQPVNTKKVPDYLDKVKTPMDLQTIRENIQNKKYRSREDFLTDIQQIVNNSITYNGGDDIYTKNARKLLEVVVTKFFDNEEKLMRLEKAINPLLDDDDQVALTYVLRSILDQVKSMQESWPFMKPVNRKNMKHYYDIIKNPMDLETIEGKVTKHEYHNRKDFLSDIELVYNNSVQFNGPDSDYSKKARVILDRTSESLAKYGEELDALEAKISEVQRRALEEEEAAEEAEAEARAAASGEVKKRKRGRPRKKPLTSEFVANSDDETMTTPLPERQAKKKAAAKSSNLADDLDYSSDDDMDFEDEEWEPVEDEDTTTPTEGLTVTIDRLDEAEVVEEGPVVDIGEFDVDESYDPSAFFNSIGKGNEEEPQQPVVEATIEVPEMVNQEPEEEQVHLPPPPPAPSADVTAINETTTASSAAIDVINDDLNISDSDSDDDNDEDVVTESSKAPPLVPEPPPPDEDGLWF